MSIHAAGDAVLRTEERSERRATVIAVDETDGRVFYLVAYAEGGSGWWPEEALEPAA